jgi:hypothetical protein
MPAIIISQESSKDEEYSKDDGINDTGGNFAASINDTGGKFATGVVDTGMPPVSKRHRGQP